MGLQFAPSIGKLSNNRCGFAKVLFTIRDAEFPKALPQALREFDKRVNRWPSLKTGAAVLKAPTVVVRIRERDGRNIILRKADVPLNASVNGGLGTSLKIVTDLAEVVVATPAPSKVSLKGKLDRLAREEIHGRKCY